MMANDGIFSAHKGAENGHRRRPWSLSSPSPSMVIAFCSPGIVHHLDGSVLAYLVGINQLARRGQPETDRSSLVPTERKRRRGKPCIRYRLAVESSHEKTGSFSSAFLVGPTHLGTDRAGRVESGERLETRLPDRGSNGVGSLGRQYWRGGFSGQHNGHRSGHQPAWADVQTSDRA